MTTYLEDALLRIVAMEKEVIPGCDAVPYFIYTQESYPYWTNRVGAIATSTDSEDEAKRVYQIIMRLVIGHRTEGYTGELEVTLQSTYIPQILTYFSQRLRLQCVAFPDIMRYIAPEGAFIPNATGLAVLAVGGIGVEEIGAEFSLELPIEEQILQAF